MTKLELKRKLLKEKKAEFIAEIEYDNKIYVKAVRVIKNDVINVYYEIKNEQIKEITDEEVLKCLKDQYELKPNNIMY